MAHKCKRIQPGHQVCPEHMLSRNGLRYRFRKQMEDVIPLEELQEWHELMKATMLPVIDNEIPLDDKPQAFIDRIANKGVAT